MQINNDKKHNNLTFNASLNLRGNVRQLSERQTDYLKQIASQIGTFTYDKIDVFVHTMNKKNAYSMIDISGYINSRLKAAHVSYTGNNIYGGILDGLKFFIGKMFNYEISQQFLNNPKNIEYNELKKFIEENKIELTKFENRDYIHAGKLIIDGAIDKISYEEAEEIAEVVNALATNPHDKFYVFIKQGDDKDKNRYLINMAGYFNHILKTALSDYQGENVYDGVKDGIKFVVEQLLSDTIKKSAERNLTKIERKQVNEMLKKQNFELVL